MAAPGTSERWQRRRRLKALLLLGIGLVVTAGALALHAADALRRLEHDTVDLRFAVRGADATPDDVLLVAIDPESFSGLQRRYLDWPRTWHAQVLRELQRGGARAVGYDVQFTEPSDVDAEDVALYEAAADAEPVVFATAETEDDGTTLVLGGDENLAAIGARAAQAGLPTDEGRTIRRMAYELENLVTFGVALAEEATGRPVPRPAPGEDLWIDYAGPPETIDTVSFVDVFEGRVPASRIRGRTVVVGPTAPTLQDIAPTSAGGGLMGGAEIQANAFRTARAGFPLRSAAGAVDIALIVLLGLLTPLLSLRLRARTALLVAAAAGIVFLVAAQVAFLDGTVVAVVAPLLALALSGVGSLGVVYFTETRERARLRTIFSRFVPEAVVEQVVDQSDARLGGVRLNSTVLFCDLRSFTTFAETLPAEQVIDVLNRYLGEMSGAILDEQGTVVAYMGDGIMAVFGAPVEMDDHADRALRAAREMAFTRLPRFNAWLAEQGLRSDFRMGIGLNSGPVMSGNVGSERRMEYTAVGDTTNTAARLEGMTKGTAFQLYLSEATRAKLSAEDPALVHQGEVPVRGRDALLDVWAIADPPRGGAEAGTEKLHEASSAG